MKIALVGNQNSGKTTLFNLLTGLNQKIGNWPGVTIDKKSGKLKGTDIEVVDLPGIYSLASYTSEEAITRNFLLEENPDIVINIIDATRLERSLYLTTQLLEFDLNIIIALNMTDILKRKGFEIDEDKLQELLGIDVVKISAHKKTGKENLIRAIKANNQRKVIKEAIFPDAIELEIAKISESIDQNHKRFVAIKLLEGSDDNIFPLDENILSPAKERLEKAFDTDTEEIIADARYDYIVWIKEKVFCSKKQSLSFTDKLDKFLLNKWIALPIFALIMFLIYYISVGAIGSLTTDYLENIFADFGIWIAQKLDAANASDWAVSLVADGIWGGVSAVLIFVPQLFVLFICLSLLETTGYMSRISFLLDKIFRHFGLSGKTIIPFIVGSGCSVPGIMATRTIEDEREKSLAIMLTPFVPCSAKLPIIALFSGYFFPKSRGLVSASVYLFAIVIIFLSALLFKAVSKKSVMSNYIAELPEYRLPSISYAARDVSSKTLNFIANAGTLIMMGSIVVWFLASFTWNFKYGMGVENSMLKGIGNAFAWLFYPMLGQWRWTAAVSAIQGFVAKEQVVSTMSIIANLSAEGVSIFDSNAFSFFTPASAYAFIVFNLFSAPCVAAVSAMRKEFGSIKKTLLAIGFQTSIAFILSYMVFGIGSLIEVIL